MVELIPNLLRQEMVRLAEQDARIDGRGRFEGREISLETDCLYTLRDQPKSPWVKPSSMPELSSRLEPHGQTDRLKVH